MGYKYLLFDADNTLYDFNASEKNAFLTLRDVDPSCFNEANYHIYHEVNDMMWKRLEKKLIEKRDLRYERFRVFIKEVTGIDDVENAKIIASRYEEALSYQCIPYDGAEEVLAALYGKYMLYVVTNGITFIQNRRFERSVLSKYITAMYISEDAGYEKPDSRYFDYVTEKIGSDDRSDYLLIGDSLSSDIDGAVGYGIDAVFFNPSCKPLAGRKPKYEIRTLAELVPLLKGME